MTWRHRDVNALYWFVAGGLFVLGVALAGQVILVIWRKS